ncbi:MAG: glycine cleavage system protein H [Alphaproteobacteria bacterium CG_4_10_14_0_2_um_filter_63_37]|nr:MAG: glycine cleavage system protein H [Proteobacteria bacterium CG1_02_64_396]PJA23809.1 MAG: glycine cleavage system protein H [Alphaproteobacteria bacterium CG_4_10_14_0_2_um_filter_63_37]
MSNPTHLRYTDQHEWIAADGRVGITDHAQELLTDIVFVELPAEGMNVTKGQEVCMIDSVKASSPVYAPADGTIVAVNQALDGAPELLNQDPFGQGWIFKLELSDAAQLDGLLDAAAYEALVAGG